MKEFFEGMSTLEQTYWGFALLGSVVFLIIFILTFIGGGDADMDADASDFEADDGGVGFQFFTFKNIVAFFTIFGWTGVTCIDNDLSTGLTLILSIIAGLLMMTVMEGFKRLFEQRSLLVRWVRNQGMLSVGRHTVLKKQLIKQAMGLR